MSKLNIDQNFAAPDDLYQQFIEMHEGLSDEESMKLNAKLIFVLANHIGDPEIIAEAIAVAKEKPEKKRPDSCLPSNSSGD